MEIRPASEADSREVWTWRNDPGTRRQSRNTSFIEWTDHAQWFSSILSSRETLSLIGVDDDRQIKIGVTRFDLDVRMHQARVSVNLNPFCRGQGLSTEFLLLSVNFFLLDHDVHLDAEVRLANLASAEIFRSVGFEIATEDHEYMHFRL
jgi:RimJ/RimL family protein N-acetyltransferase